jgi:RNA polymerase sigma-70 factor (ECF subfamily)
MKTHQAEAAVQEAYVRAWFKLGQFHGPAGFASWLYQIATNEALMRRRRQRAAHLTGLDADDDGSAAAMQMAELRARVSSPAAELHELQLRQLLESAIDGLPDVYREAFVLREIEQMSVAETAHRLGIEEGAVKTRVHRARKLLQRNLTDELSVALTGAFDFDGARCDRLVAGVIQRINAEQTAAPGPFLPEDTDGP